MAERKVLAGLAGLTAAMAAQEETEQKTSLFLQGKITLEDGAFVFRCPLNALPTIDGLPINERTELRDGKPRTFHTANICMKADMPDLDITFQDGNGGTVTLPVSKGGNYGPAKCINIGLSVSKARIVPAAQAAV